MKENSVVVSIDKLLNEKQKCELAYKKLQRQRDLKVDIINQKYSDKIDQILRKSQFIEMQMTQARDYSKNNLNGVK